MRSTASISTATTTRTCSSRGSSASTGRPAARPRLPDINDHKSAGNFDLNIGQRNIEGGGRSSLFDPTNYRVVGEATGEIIDGITYDAYAQHYYTTLYNANGNYLSSAGVNYALLVGGSAANPACLSGDACVPYNIFQQGSVTQAQLAALYEPGIPGAVRATGAAATANATQGNRDAAQ
ncbi:MAG TPA: hypothetical protein VNY82_17285 [Steroidobacteraceae bacterium]|nr:hypothetical protein [Steroidobacteraceae bacterium]